MYNKIFDHKLSNKTFKIIYTSESSLKQEATEVPCGVVLCEMCSKINARAIKTACCYKVNCKIKVTFLCCKLQTIIICTIIVAFVTC